MNQISEVLTTLIHYKVVVRDSLEYTLPKDAYDVALFKEKKRSILVEVDQPTPLKSILDRSGDNGKNLEKTIRDFYDQVYGDSSTILKLADDGLRVDHAQHLAIFKGVLPIHENVEAMCIGIINDAKKNNVDVTEAAAVDLAEERLYRGVAYMTLTAQLVKLFGDYNQARREAKGEETAASRFIGNDINETIQDLNIVRANCHLTDERYNSVQDKVFLMVDFMTGRRDLPMGKSFPDIIKETQDSVAGYVREVEPAFRDIYVPLINALVEQAKNDDQKIKGTPAEAAAPAEAKPVEGKPVEIDPKTGLPKA
jgi:hypothetical protein